MRRNGTFLLSFAVTVFVTVAIGAVFFIGLVFARQDSYGSFFEARAENLFVRIDIKDEAVSLGAVIPRNTDVGVITLIDKTREPETYEQYEAFFEECTIMTAQSSLRGRVIVLDAGHCDNTGGAIAGYREGVRMLYLAKLMRDELESRGATVLMTRDSGDDLHNTLRVAMMNLWSLEAIVYDRHSSGQFHSAELSELAGLIDTLNRIISNRRRYAQVYMNHPFDQYLMTRIHPTWRRVLEFQSDPVIRYNWLAISLHSNASYPFDESRNGAIVFYSSNTNPMSRFYFANYSHEYNMRLFGNMLLSEIAQTGIRRNRLRSSSYMFIRETNLPAVLVENGFHTNPGDRALLSCNIFMQRLAVAYADTIEEYFRQIRYGSED